MNNIVIDFKNIISELENKELKIGIMNNNVHSICLEDKRGNVYVIETYWNGSYLERLISKEATVIFNRLESPNVSFNKIWSASEFKEYIETQSKYWV